jgi:predicted dehydrogenase
VKIKAAKHVLCEKPLSMTVAEAETLLEVRARTGVKIVEALVVDCHPQCCG